MLVTVIYTNRHYIMLRQVPDVTRVVDKPYKMNQSLKQCANRKERIFEVCKFKNGCDQAGLNYTVYIFLHDTEILDQE